VKLGARALMSSGSFMTGALIVAFWGACAVVGRIWAPFDPFADDILGALRPPSSAHWFGTDQLGRDVLSRVIAGSRDVLEVAPLATGLGLVLGVLVGLITGYFRGSVDEIVGRVIDALLALPLVIIALLALTAIGASTITVIVVVGVIFAPLIARTVRAAVLSERELDYVAAARLRNESTMRILIGEILPNVLPPILVEATVRLGYAVFAVATLSFLGFGIQPPSPDWGLAVSETYGLINGGIWWPALFNTLAISSLVIAVNLAADGLRSSINA
jgi:peptide/nickel transport system permease protein